MMKPTCPKCGSTLLVSKGGGMYFCQDCGYLGSLGIAKDFVKMMK